MTHKSSRDKEKKSVVPENKKIIVARKKTVGQMGRKKGGDREGTGETKEGKKKVGSRKSSWKSVKKGGGQNKR